MTYVESTTYLGVLAELDGGGAEALPEVGFGGLVPWAVGHVRPHDLAHGAREVGVVAGVGVEVGVAGLLEEEAVCG